MSITFHLRNRRLCIYFMYIFGVVVDNWRVLYSRRLHRLCFVTLLPSSVRICMTKILESECFNGKETNNPILCNKCNSMRELSKYNQQPSFVVSIVYNPLYPSVCTRTHTSTHNVRLICFIQFISPNGMENWEEKEWEQKKLTSQ